MKYKLLASDIDGTLIDPAQRLTDATAAAIERFKRAGGIFTIATGRPLMGVSKYLPLVSPLTPVITYNGAMIIIPENGEIVYEQTLEPTAALELIRRGAELGVMMVLWSKNELYTSEINDAAVGYSRMTGEKLNLIREPERLVGQGISKCIWMASPDKIAEYGAQVAADPVPNACCCTSTPTLLEFMHRDVSKGEGLRRLCKYCGLSLAEAAAAGDELNDMSMIRAAGLGIAMGNAHDDIKRAADMVTLSNNENGLAHAIDSMLK